MKKTKEKPLPVFVLRGNTDSVVCLDWSPDGSTLATGALDGSLMVWNYESRRCVVKFAGAHGDKGINTVSFDLNLAGRLWTQGRDGWIRQWDIESQQCVSAHEVDCHGFVGLSVAYSKSQCFGALQDPADMRGVLLLRMDGKENNVTVLKQFKSPETDGMCMKLHCIAVEERCFIYCGYESGNVVLYTFDAGDESLPERQHWCVPTEKAFPLTAICFDQKSGLGCVAGAEDCIFPFKANPESSPDELFFLQCRLSIPQRGVNDVAFRFDSRVYATACWDGRIRFFATKKGRERIVCVGEFHSEAINSVAFRPNSKILAAASKDGKISLWNVL